MLTSCATLGKEVNFPLWLQVLMGKMKCLDKVKSNSLLIAFDILQSTNEFYGLMFICNKIICSVISSSHRTHFYLLLQKGHWHWRFVAFLIKSQELIWCLYKAYTKLSVRKTYNMKDSLRFNFKKTNSFFLPIFQSSEMEKTLISAFHPWKSPSHTP